MVALPLEILSEILKNLTLHKRNQAVLTNCSLICSTWHAIVRPWICASITFNVARTSYARLVQTKAVFSACPYIPAYARTLSIEDNKRKIGLTLGELLRAMDELGIIAALSGHVQCLILDFKWMISRHNIKEISSAYLSKFSAVQHLRLINATVPSYALLKSTFPFVNTLSLDFVTFEEPFYLEDESIQRLHISTDVGGFRTHWLPSEPGDRVSPPIHLRLYWKSWYIEQPWEVIEAIPTPLKFLTLHGESCVFQIPGEDEVLRELFLHSFSGLWSQWAYILVQHT
jgi:hypothetical protein